MDTFRDTLKTLTFSRDSLPQYFTRFVFRLFRTTPPSCTFTSLLPSSTIQVQTPRSLTYLLPLRRPNPSTTRSLDWGPHRVEGKLKWTEIPGSDPHGGGVPVNITTTVPFYETQEWSVELCTLNPCVRVLTTPSAHSIHSQLLSQKPESRNWLSF